MILGNVVWDNVRYPAQALLGLSCPIQSRKASSTRADNKEKDIRKSRQVIIHLFLYE